MSPPGDSLATPSPPINCLSRSRHKRPSQIVIVPDAIPPPPFTMPPRKKPFSAKQKKEQLQLKRAVKRGEIEPPPKLDRHGRPQKKPMAQINASPGQAAAVDASRRLQSSFFKLSADFLDDTRALASEIPLTRPIPPQAAIWQETSSGSDTGCEEPKLPLTCPKRPKWRYGMSKKEVEMNEEGLFSKWLAQTDAAVNQWAASINEPVSEDTAPVAKMPSAPTSFERNLEVWRQLYVSLLSSVHLRPPQPRHSSAAGA